MTWWHGGRAGHRVGDELTGGHDRTYDGCPICVQRARGEDAGIDPPTGHPDEVYVTTDREYARFYASMARYGDLYQVEPVGEVVPSDEDFFPTWRCRTARVVAVYARAVLLTPGQRAALTRRWVELEFSADGKLDVWNGMSHADQREYVNRAMRDNTREAYRIAADARLRGAGTRTAAR